MPLVYFFDIYAKLMSSVNELLYVIIFTGLIAVFYSYLLSKQILKASPGNAKMQEIAEAIQIGAKAYLKRQYITIAIVLYCLFK